MANAGKDEEPSYRDGGNAKWYSHSGENSLAVAFKMKHTTTLTPETALLGFYPREMEICVHTKTPVHNRS